MGCLRLELRDYEKVTSTSLGSGSNRLGPDLYLCGGPGNVHLLVLETGFLVDANRQKLLRQLKRIAEAAGSVRKLLSLAKP
jgi:hypothetical protein